MEYCGVDLYAVYSQLCILDEVPRSPRHSTHPEHIPVLLPKIPGSGTYTIRPPAQIQPSGHRSHQPDHPVSGFRSQVLPAR
jgi:hypothetical protein